MTGGENLPSTPLDPVLKAGLAVAIVAVGIGPPAAFKRTRAAQELVPYEIDLNIILLVSSVAFMPLAKRILEVDRYASDDKRVIEVHPEVSFRELAERPLESKHRVQGLVERRALLENAGIEIPASVARIAEPDLLDAAVVAWSARRYARREAVPLPDGYRERIGAIWR